MAIAIVGSVSSATGGPGGSLTIVDYVLGAGADLLIVCTGVSRPAGDLVSSVVIDAGGANETALTLAVTERLADETRNDASIYYTASPPPAGTYDVTITVDSYTNSIAAACWALSGATGPPEDTAGHQVTVASPTTISASLTTVSDGAVIVDVLSRGITGSPTPASDQTSRFSVTYDGGSRIVLAGSDKEIASAGVVEHTWNTGTSAWRTVLIMAAFPPLSIVRPAGQLVTTKYNDIAS